MTNTITGKETRERIIKTNARDSAAAIFFFGAMWGFIEATVGFTLHLLPRLLPFPRVAGFVMFPIGLIFMIGAVRSTGRASSALGVASVASALKLASAALPAVSWIFVVNPAIAILSEGLIVVLALQISSFVRLSAGSAAAAFGVSVGWRGLFLLINLTAGITGGILSRPAGALLEFLFLEGAVNGLLITAMMAAGLFATLGSDRIRRTVVRPVPAAAALAFACIAELVTAGL